MRSWSHAASREASDLGFKGYHRRVLTQPSNLGNADDSIRLAWTQVGDPARSARRSVQRHPAGHHGSVGFVSPGSVAVCEQYHLWDWAGSVTRGISLGYESETDLERTRPTGC